MSTSDLFQYQIVDNSKTIISDIWKNPQYLKGVVDTSQFDIIVYSKILVCPTRYVPEFVLYNLPYEEVKELLPHVLTEIEDLSPEWISELIFDAGLFVTFINDEWERYGKNYGLWRKCDFQSYRELLTKAYNKILLSLKYPIKIEDNPYIKLRKDGLLVSIINDTFFDKLLNFNTSKVEDYLEYHFHKYQGKKRVFIDELDFILNSHEIDKYILPNFLNKELLGVYNPEPYSNYRVALNWIATKRVEIAINGSKTEKTNTNTKGLTTKQQVLILHYLEILGGNWGLSSQRKFIKFLSKFLNVHKDTVKEGLLNKCIKSKTKENLEVVRELFEEFGLPTDKIIKDIDEIEK